MTTAQPVHIGILAFPGVLQMDVTGPYGVFASAPGAQVDLVWKDTSPVLSSDKLALTPNLVFSGCPPLDVLCVPGGTGILALLDDHEVHDFLHEQAGHARYLCSVCTGSLALAAAGLLNGYKATTHWQSLDLLKEFDLIPVAQRVVMDRGRVSAAGVSAGIDMALCVVGEIWGPDAARRIELSMEYDPHPPFRSGHPSLAPKEIVDILQTHNAARQQIRLEAVRNAAKRLRER
jgi:cyclohexyl-isocyanide hydratase